MSIQLQYTHQHNNSNVTNMYPSITLIIKWSSSACRQLRLKSNYVMHLIPTHTCMWYQIASRSSPYDATNTSFVRFHARLTIHRIKSTPFYNINDSTWLWCMDIQLKTRQCKITSYIFDDNIKDNLHLYWPTSTTIALSNIYVHTINKSQFN